MYFWPPEGLGQARALGGQTGVPNVFQTKQNPIRKVNSNSVKLYFRVTCVALKLKLILLRCVNV
jgi:hypothetical protein